MMWYLAIGVSLVIAGTVYLMTAGAACISLGLSEHDNHKAQIGRDTAKLTAVLLAVELACLVYLIGE